MAITKARKQSIVGGYRDLIGRSHGIVLASYIGSSVKDMERLRRKVRETGGEFHVIKNRLVKLALQEAGLGIGPEALRGPTAVGFIEDDPIALTKAMAEFARESEFVRLKGGILDGVAYDGSQMVRIADIPPLPVVRAQLLGVLSAPGSRVAGALASSVRQLVNVVKAYSDKVAAAAA